MSEGTDPSGGSAPSACVVRVQALQHRYKKTLALDRISLEIPAGRLVGLIGPDGVGKSSLLALIAGVRKIQSGRVETLAGDMTDGRHRRRICPRIAYMPEGLGKNLYMTLSVYENIDFFGRLFGQQTYERRQRIDELLVSTGLAPFRDRPAGKLSGGMKQKLGLCCALIHDPDLLILDEPTTGVDPLSRRQFWTLIARIRRRRPRMSVIVATAYMEEAAQFDWLIAMDAGRVLETGSPGQLLQMTGTTDLDAAFIALLPAAKRAGHSALTVPPRRHQDDGPPAIRARELTRRFGDFTAVDGVSFEIERGEIFGFLGSNGCGKTTTMKMLTGLLPASGGEAEVLGHPVDASDLAMRRRVGFMSQAFSLYGELTVQQNLELHARLFQLPSETISRRVAGLSRRFGLHHYADALAEALPLGIRQRLALAVAVIHQPEILILDEPTSGVDPVARDQFWQLLADLSREDGVTVFVSTHFMNEGERCDRISLMHAGRVLASDSPSALIAARGRETLEKAFIDYLEQAVGESTAPAPSEDPVTVPPSARVPSPGALRRGWLRLFGYARRETLELRRDPIRLTFALLGTALLMFVLGYGISMDVEDIAFAALDLDRTPASRDYISNIAGSGYFAERQPIANDAELDRRMRSGELSLVIEIPPGFGRDLARGRSPAVGAWIDGAMPFRAETILGYVRGMHQEYLANLALRTQSQAFAAGAAVLEVRYRYNQAFKSLYAMVPATIPLLLVLIPAMLTALGVVREKELGSITNFYATPVSRLEFLIGKQMPYVAISMLNFFLLILLAIVVLDVPLKGSLMAFTLAALLYVSATTGLGLLMSTFTRTQIAAIFATAIATMLPAIQFSGLTNPVSALEGAAAVLGSLYPTTYFLTISRGVFTKALGFADLYRDFLALAAFIPVLTLLNVLLLRKQEA